MPIVTLVTLSCVCLVFQSVPVVMQLPAISKALGMYSRLCDAGLVSFSSINTGVCACDPGWRGLACQYSDAETCNRQRLGLVTAFKPSFLLGNGHGTVDDNGVCTCSVSPGDTAFAGTYCDQCAPDYYNYPSCKCE
jgi:hypothetical protein